jgi:hypothetical protein
LALEARTVCALDGYLFEHGEFSASFAKDDRIMTGLKVTARSRLLPLPLEHRNGPDLIIVPIVVSPSACAVFISPIMVTHRLSPFSNKARCSPACARDGRINIAATNAQHFRTLFRDRQEAISRIKFEYSYELWIDMESICPASGDSMGLHRVDWVLKIL